jgi:hypothetical protein
MDIHEGILSVQGPVYRGGDAASVRSRTDCHARRGENSRMGRLGTCLLLLMFSMLSSAATLQSAYQPPAGGTGRDAPVNRQDRNRAPIPAPAPTDHYAATMEKKWTLS